LINILICYIERVKLVADSSAYILTKINDKIYHLLFILATYEYDANDPSQQSIELCCKPRSLQHLS